MSVRWPFIGREVELDMVGAAMAERAGVLLVGAAGVGKTRLAYEAINGGDPDRYLGLWAAATSAARSIPFGALASLLPSTIPDPVSPVDLFRRAGDALVTRAGGRRLVLGIDDAHLLDDMSAAFVHQLATSGQACVLVTVRSGEPVPDPITALWKEDLVVRLEIDPLPAAAAQEVLAAALGGHVDGATSRRMWEVTAGNMLLLRELVNAGLDSGSLAEAGGVWRWEGPWVVAPRLAELIVGRIGRLEPAQQDVLEVVAYGEPVGADVLVGLTDQGVVLSLESANLLWMWQDGRRVNVRLCHPLYGEVLRANASPLRARLVRQRLADAVEATGARRRDDWLRIATWRLDGAAAVSPAVLTTAARQAFGTLDLPLAERLAQAAVDAGDLGAGEVLWRVLFLGGRAEEAEGVITRLLGLPMSDSQRGEFAFGRAYNLFWGLRWVDDAYAVVRDALETISDRGWLAELGLLQCVFELLQGRPRVALDGVTRFRTGTTEQVTAQAMSCQGMALTQLGRLSEARAVLEDAVEPVSRCTHVPWVAESIRAFRCYVELLAGRLDAAGEQAAGFYAHAVETGWDFPLGLSCGLRAHVARLRGQVRTAARWAREGHQLLAAQSSPFFRNYLLGEHAHAEALAGNPAVAAAALAEADRVPAPAEALMQPWLELARPWVATAAGNTGDAVELALAAAAYARGQEAVVFEAFALHDAARLGVPAAVVDRLSELAGTADGEWIAVLASHVAAMLAGRPEPLVTAADRLAGLGADLLAAEAYIQAARAGLRSARATSAWTARATLLLSRCEGASTPITVEIDPPKLTRRQRDIARMAAAGLSNQDIADRLVVSVRTVENHLYRVYTMLGVSDRAELGDVMPPDQ